MLGTIKDRWAQWLLKRRFGEHPEEARRATLESLIPVRDRILDHAQLAEGETLLDVGTGDGLIAFGALERVGSRGKVIFSDISQDLLDHSQALAQEMGILNRCQFLLASADDLSGLVDSSVDVVTTRSVLIFVESKQRAIQEFYRVLKPQGRLSIFEPINRFAHPEPKHLFWGFDVDAVQDIARKVRVVYERIQPLDTDPMLNFDERDLLAFAEEAGFEEVHLELRADISPKPHYKTWERLLHTAGNPKIPTLQEAMQQALTADEARQFSEHLRPLVMQGQGTSRMAMAYLWAVK